MSQPDANQTPTCQPFADKLAVHDWHVWQSYRNDRGTPPWIKIHRCLLSSEKWAALTDAQKGHLVSIWIAAADNNGMVPANPRIIKKICQLDSEPDVELFKEMQLLETTGSQLDANLTPTRRQHDAPEESRGEERREEKISPLPPLGGSVRKRFLKPTPGQIEEYCKERNNGISGQEFWDSNEAKGWVIGKTPMKDWKAAVRTWENRRRNDRQKEKTYDPFAGAI